MDLHHFLQAIYRSQYLSYLIGFGFALVVLDVDTRVSRPGSFVNTMTAARLPRFTKVVVADLAQVSKPDSFGISSHLLDDAVNL